MQAFVHARGVLHRFVVLPVLAVFVGLAFFLVPFEGALAASAPGGATGAVSAPAAGNAKKAAAASGGNAQPVQTKKNASRTGAPKKTTATAPASSRGSTVKTGTAQKSGAASKAPRTKAAAVPAKKSSQPAPAAPAAKTKAAAKPVTFPASQVSAFDAKAGGKLPIAETWIPLVNRLAKDGVAPEYLRAMFGRMGDSYSHEPMGTKINELFSNKFVPKPPRAATAPPKSAAPAIYKSMVKPENVGKCKVYLETHKAAFAGMEAQYGVPKEIVAALLMVETRLGTYLGHNSSFWSLACMAAADKPDRVEATVKALPLPMTPDKEEWLQKILRERSSWAYKELLALIRHGRDNGLDPLGMPGSVYGAIGICQFMPSNLPKYAVDGNKDGRIDPFDPADAIPSVGNFLKEHGWSGKDWLGKDRSNHHAALKRYNKSTIYANTILALADAIVAPPEAAVATAAPGKTKTPSAAAAKAGGKQSASGTAQARSAKPAAKQEAKKAPAAKAAGKAKAQGSQTRTGQKKAAAGSSVKAGKTPGKTPAKTGATAVPAAAEPAGQAPASPDVPEAPVTPAAPGNASL